MAESEVAEMTFQESEVGGVYPRKQYEMSPLPSCKDQEASCKHMVFKSSD